MMVLRACLGWDPAPGEGEGPSFPQIWVLKTRERLDVKHSGSDRPTTVR